MKIQVIEVFDKNNNLINTYNFVSDIVKQMGLKRSNINNNLCNLSKSAGGYIFKYKEV